MSKLKFILFSLFFVGCQQKNTSIEENYNTSQVVLEKPEYINWFFKKEATINKTKEIDDITYSLKYKPAEFIACMEKVSDKTNETNFEKQVEDLDGLDYYDFKIQITSGEGELLKYKISSSEDYDQRVNYFAFGMEKDIQMVEGKDTLKCVLFHFERAYDIVPYATFILGFTKSKSPTSEKTFIYNDKIFKNGLVKITYTPKELSQIPKLKTI